MKNAVVTGGGSGIGAGHRAAASRRRLARRDSRPHPVRRRVRLHRRRDRPGTGRRGARRHPRSTRAGDRSGQCRGPGEVQAFHRHHIRGVAAGHRRQPQRRLPLHPGGTARHDRGGLGPHRQHLLVEHPLGSAVHVALRGRQVGRQWAHQIARARVRAQRASPSTRCRLGSSTPRCCASPRRAAT